MSRTDGCTLIVVSLTVAGLTAATALDAGSEAEPASSAGRPKALEARGRLVCLAEEMKERYRAEVPPVHDHVLGFRLEGEPPAGAFRYYTILRTPLSEALFVDDRFRKHELVLTGRVFPGSAILEVSRFQWRREGKLFDVYYWCEVCAIKGVDPGLCACCKGNVELREAPVPEAERK